MSDSPEQASQFGGDSALADDGILLAGRTLHVAENQLDQIAEIKLSGDDNTVVQVAKN